MYIEELYNLVDELDLKKEDVDNMKVIIGNAGNQYLLKMAQDTLTDSLEFVINGRYIKQSELLSQLGISAYPKSWKQLCTDYGDNPFGPSDSVSFTITEYQTHIVFPTRLFKEDRKDYILKKVKKNSL